MPNIARLKGAARINAIRCATHSRVGWAKQLYRLPTRNSLPDFGYFATLRLRHARGGSGAVSHRRCVAHDASRELSVLAKVGA